MIYKLTTGTKYGLVTRTVVVTAKLGRKKRREALIASAPPPDGRRTSINKGKETIGQPRPVPSIRQPYYSLHPTKHIILRFKSCPKINVILEFRLSFQIDSTNKKTLHLWKGNPYYVVL
jgi:hypothetical protein